MITPVNTHVLIEPLTHESFMQTQRETYEEIGIVVAAADDAGSDTWTPEPGERVYFDAWLAAKYPKQGGKDGEFYWLVKWEDIRAVELAQPVPETPSKDHVHAEPVAL